MGKRIPENQGGWGAVFCQSGGKWGRGKPGKWVERGGTDYWGMSWGEAEGR